MKGYKTLIKPSKDKVKRHLRQVGEVIDKNKGTPQEALIGKLNPIIRGWCNYYSTVISTKIFASVNHFTYEKLRAWAKRRHPNENAHQISNKYWLIGQGGGWTFAARKEEKTYKLLKHNEVPIIRHIKVEGYRTPYDGDWSYWATRTGKHPQLPNKVAKLLNQQKGKCQYCGLYFTPESLMEVHHLDENHKNQKWNNLALVHRHCHDQIHGIQNHDIGNQVLETDFLVENLF
nr:group II intron maturase-specific domain-containing protein [Brasilonema bromeliae]